MSAESRGGGYPGVNSPARRESSVRSLLKARQFLPALSPKVLRKMQFAGPAHQMALGLGIV